VLAMNAIGQTLAGVGIKGQKHIEHHEVAIHYRRPMNDDELARIDLSKRKGQA
jgi:hypothetical protein